uniref:zinc finger protein Rlf n=1 Tax=Doryrhamphus excisus TaxID=161450 RepID=UPI0025AE8607|nr:zinc finger protein Rlf [Doryrhamphus excisus]
MAESNVEAEHEWSERGLDTAEDTLVAMETLLATLKAFEDVLRQQELSAVSSSEYCDNFCQALMHYAGTRNSIDHGLPLLEVYCLSINCFAAARSHLTVESDKVTLVLKRLALSCFELFLSVPDNEIPYEAWIQFHHSVQIAHDILLEYGSTDLQALLQITGEGGAWSNPVLSALLTGQPTIQQEVDTYISLEGDGFMEMRVKHLEKMGEVAKAVVLAKACTECSAISNQATFCQTYIALLCQLLPNEEAIMEISRLNCKDVLEITSNLETEGEENTGFILCTTFLTQQLQQASLDQSWELTLVWSKLQRKIDPSLVSLLERCLQLGAIAKTVQHLLYLVRVIQTEAQGMGTAASVELGVKALRLPKQDDMEMRIGICKVVSGLLLNDLEVLRACQLTEFLLAPSQQVLSCLQELYLRPDQKYEQENGVIPNSLRCELFLALKAHWPFDPEFWDWKAIKYQCISLLGLKAESEDEDEAPGNQESEKLLVDEIEHRNILNGGLKKEPCHLVSGEADMRRIKLCCRICNRSFSETRIIHHSKRHIVDDGHPCPICLQKWKSRKELIPHLKHHIQNETLLHNSSVIVKNKELPKPLNEDDEMEPGEITIDPSLILYYRSTHDPNVLQHIVQQAKTVKDKHVDEDEFITFDYMTQHFTLQNREEYFCPATECTRVFQHSKYLYVHLKSHHKSDENVMHFHQMREKREKCVFCRRHFVSAYHHRKHRKIHFGEHPYMCVVKDCGARFHSSNELLMHKQVHGYQLNFQCELTGCYLAYSDLGQLYHHEAQHFRDAAFTCTSPKCKKFYFSKREFIEHLSTHDITFSEKDFEAQRKAKQMIFQADLERVTSVNKPVTTEGSVNGDDQKASSGSCTPYQPSASTEGKAVVTLVAMCFDGSKFTCGFEKCGMTFSRARDVQRHLKHAHPDHLKLENKEHKHDKEQGSKSKKIKIEIESDNEEDHNQLSALCSPMDNGTGTLIAPSKNNRTSLAKNDLLKDILIRFNKLDLNSLSPPSVPHKSIQEANASLHRSVVENQPIVLLSKASNENITSLAENSSAHKVESVVVETLANAKPYTCEIGKCRFRSAQSYSLLRHYVSIHGRTQEQAKAMTSLKTTSFKPFICQLCSKCHREKQGLRAHYIHIHKLSASLVDKLKSKSSKSTIPQSFNPKMKLEVPSVEREETKSSDIEQNPCIAAPSLAVNGTREEAKEEREDGATPQLRTRRLVAKSNLCYILDKLGKPFHCVAKNCEAAFSTQGGLVRHLQLVHHYKRSQLLLEKDLEMQQHYPEVKKENSKKSSPYPNLDEPKPQFKCQFAKCSASYHLKSSLARHTRMAHSQMPGMIRCKYEGCTKVFSSNDSLKKHTFYRHCQYYDSLVVRLQSTHKKSVTGCQKKLIVTPKNPVKELVPHPTSAKKRTQPKSEDVCKNIKEEKRESRPKKSKPLSTYVFKSHEEALQMCQDRSLRAAYPCMVQDCDSVVMYVRSLFRHYDVIHHICRKDVQENADKLLSNAEQLEELIQRKSARPTVTGADNPDGVCKMEYQPELDKSEELPEPVSLHSVKDEEAEKEEAAHPEPLGFPDEVEEPPHLERSGVLVGADDVLYGEPSTGSHAEDSVVTVKSDHTQVEKLTLDKTKALLRPLTIDLSLPCSVLFNTDDALQDTLSSKESGKIVEESSALPAPVRQPLKRKNELSVQPSNVKDPQLLPSAPRSFDITTYKPIGFEVSFLKFIEETTPKEKSPTAVKRRDSFRHSCSVKENNQLGIKLTRSRRSHSSSHKSQASTKDLPSVRNLKSILDKALAGCGDLAIKQLQYLRPVVVLGKPVCTATLPHLFSSDPNNSKLLLESQV